MSEDRAMLRSNLSAGMVVSGKGGARAHHSFCFLLTALNITLLRKP